MHDLKQVKLKLGNQYIISFTGLIEGEHSFEFDFKQEFFDEYELLNARSGNLNALVILYKKTNMLSLDVSLKGYLEVQCDRCLDFFRLPIQYQGELVVKFGEDSSGGNDEIWIVPPGEHQLKLQQYFYECIGLCLPISRMHPDHADGTSGCNEDMLRRLNSHSHDIHEEENDPRWNKLKDINK
ncbi:MAG: DUF177 domain-containing protein [Bacteroidales bacterium]|nr:DUF177 domain-containing protein [Bacteroidales bacterium]